jgi:hypothetical protein
MKNSLLLILSLLGGLTTIYTIRKVMKSPKERFEIAIRKLGKKYPTDILKNIERIYRLESAHFKSGQFKGTNSPGMESFGASYPWGWKTLARIFWNENREFAPIGKKVYTEGKTGFKKTFLVFPSMYAAVYTLAAFLTYYNNNPGRWFSTNEDSQNKYNRVIYSIRPTIVDKLITNGEI